MKKRLSLNLILSISLQIITIIYGLILPRLIISTFGSNINGLVSSLNQQLNYVSLLEGGVSGVMMASLYKPLYDENKLQISRIVKAMNKFFKTISYIFVGYMIIIAIFYPFVIHTNFSWSYIFTLTLILGSGLFIQYNLSYTYKLLLDADNKIYLTTFTQALTLILNVILAYISIKIFPSIHLLKFLTALTFFIQPILYRHFVKKYFNLDDNVTPDDEALSRRWDGFGINVAAFVHNNTDVTLITLFSTLKNVSVYTVYFFVINGIRSINLSIINAITPTFGNIIASNDQKKLTDFFINYEFASFSITTITFTLGACLILPFVLLYTHGVKDANYYQPIFAIVLLVAEAIYILRDPYVNFSYQANHFREISKYAYIEAILNIILSIILINKLGILGVAIGTLVSITFRGIMQIIYCKQHLLNRSYKYPIKNAFFFIGILLLSLFIFNYITQSLPLSIFTFAFRIIIAMLITFSLYGIVVIIFYRDNLIKIKNLIRPK